MRIKLMVGASALALALTMAGCSSDNSSNANANSNSNVSSNSNTRASMDETTAPEYTTSSSEANGVTTETRIYNNNPRVSKVVITTKNGKRTATVYNASGEERELHTDDLDDVLRKSGNAIADAAGFVADKAEDVGGKVKDVGKDIGEKTVEGGKTVVEKTGEGAKKVGEKTAEGAKTVGEKTVEGAKKTGKAIKNAVTP